MATASSRSLTAGWPNAADPSRADAGSRQAQIWATVKKTQDRLARSVGATPAPASPSSLQLSLESEKLKAAQAAYMSALQSGALDHDVIGYVAAINGKISGGDVDVYASSDLFRKMWPKLLAASVTEAISEKAAQNATPPSADSVGGFIMAAANVPESERRSLLARGHRSRPPDTRFQT